MLAFGRLQQIHHHSPYQQHQCLPLQVVDVQPTRVQPSGHSCQGVAGRIHPAVKAWAGLADCPGELGGGLGQIIQCLGKADGAGIAECGVIYGAHRPPRDHSQVPHGKIQLLCCPVQPADIVPMPPVRRGVDCQLLGG